MLTPPLVMIDLDHSYDRATQTITDPQAAEIVQSLNSYTELSPSGTGLHILTYGQLPGKGIHTAIEMYGQDRFTTITTNHLAGTPATIRTATGSTRRTLSPLCTSSYRNHQSEHKGGCLERVNT